MGQELSKSLLINILNSKTEIHSFIFYGPNGTGKTTSARLFAKAVNCQKFKELGDICGECPPCLVSFEDNCTDIIEIDGATHNGVEFVREINKNSIYPPLKLNKKLYIIDEAHCLSVQSWNALLKLVEEPPDHLILILITTEVKKIIPTILSRCQKLYFPALSMGEISSFLEKVTESEGQKAQKNHIQKIAEESRGSAREALVMLEKYLINQKETDSLQNIDNDNQNAFEFLKLIFESKLIQAMTVLKEDVINLPKLFEMALNQLLELSFYEIGDRDPEILSLLDSEQANTLLKKKAQLSSMINFLAPHLSTIGKENFSLAYSKFLLLNLLTLAFEKTVKFIAKTVTPSDQENSKDQHIEEDKYGKKPLKPGELLSEPILSGKSVKNLPETSELYTHSLLKFSSFDLPSFEFQEILSQEEVIIQLLKECKKEKGEKRYEILKNYLDSEETNPLISELFKNMHMTYKLICSDKKCLVVFPNPEDSQYFNLKIKNYKLKEELCSIFEKPISFISIASADLPKIIKKKKLYSKSKSTKNQELSNKDTKLLNKIRSIFQET